MSVKRFAKWFGATSLLFIVLSGIAIWSSQSLQIAVVNASGIADWRVKPTEIADNFYYVGGFDTGAFLLTGDDGHILIDGGYENSASMILANIRELGFSPKDIKIILNTHAHFDHAGGIAAVKMATGAKLLASPKGAKLMAAGGRGDFHFGDELTYPGVKADGMLSDQKAVTLGNISLTPQFTPGHTKGCTSWSWTAMIHGKPRQVLLICSLGQLGTPLKNNNAYPDIAEDFERSFARMGELECDIFLTPHGTQIDVSAKGGAVRNGNAFAFVDPAGCKSYIGRNRDTYRKALAEADR